MTSSTDYNDILLIGQYDACTLKSSEINRGFVVVSRRALGLGRERPRLTPWDIK